jgi:hypothetical protein
MPLQCCVAFKLPVGLVTERLLRNVDCLCLRQSAGPARCAVLGTCKQTRASTDSELLIDVVLINVLACGNKSVTNVERDEKGRLSPGDTRLQVSAAACSRTRHGQSIGDVQRVTARPPSGTCYQKGSNIQGKETQLSSVHPPCLCRRKIEHEFRSFLSLGLWSIQHVPAFWWWSVRARRAMTIVATEAM